METHNYTISRTLLLYPRTSFFVLFHNVVATSDRDDFNLIKGMTEDLSSLAVFSHYIENLHQVFSVFVSLSEQILDNRVGELGLGSNWRGRKRIRTSATPIRAGRRKIPDSKDVGKCHRGAIYGTDPTGSSGAQHKSERQQTPPPWESGAFVNTFSLHEHSTDSSTARGPSSTPELSSKEVQATVSAPGVIGPEVNPSRAAEAEHAERVSPTLISID